MAKNSKKKQIDIEKLKDKYGKLPIKSPTKTIKKVVKPKKKS